MIAAMHAGVAEVVYVAVAEVVRTGAYEQTASCVVATLTRGRVSGVLLDLEGVTSLDQRQLTGVLSIAVAPLLRGVETRVAGLSPALAERLSWS